MDKERHRILRQLDVDAALPEFRSHGFPPARHEVTGEPTPEREVVLCGMHKARVYAARAFSRAEVALSKRWLREHQYSVPGEEH